MYSRDLFEQSFWAHLVGFVLSHVHKFVVLDENWMSLVIDLTIHA